MTAPLRAGEPIIVNVALGARSYDIVIGRGVLGSLGERIKALRPGARVAIVSDETVVRHCLAATQQALSGIAAAAPAVVPPGEGSKSFPVFEKVCEALIEARIERGDLVLALGGGVVGDLAGFAAAVVRRGLDYVQVPTTLLSQVDSSVGGKTAIDSRHGKNLVGAFHQPLLVVADTALLDTLPEREFRAGYAEVAKYGLISDAAFFAWLESNWREIFSGGPAREHAISATPSGTPSRRLLASRNSCCTEKQSRSAWCARSTSRPAAGLRRWLTPSASGSILRRWGCLLICQMWPGDCLMPTG
jgi:3-dehydroquinate synthetase